MGSCIQTHCCKELFFWTGRCYYLSLVDLMFFVRERDIIIQYKVFLQVRSFNR